MLTTAPISRPPALPPSIASASPVAIAFRDEVFGDSDEVGEGVPLLHHASGIVPGLAHIAAAANVRDRRSQRRDRAG